MRGAWFRGVLRGLHREGEPKTGRDHRISFYGQRDLLDRAGAGGVEIAQNTGAHVERCGDEVEVFVRVMQHREAHFRDADISAACRGFGTSQKRRITLILGENLCVGATESALRAFA